MRLPVSDAVFSITANGGVYARQQQGTGEGAAANIATYLIYFRITNLN